MANEMKNETNNETDNKGLDRFGPGVRLDSPAFIHPSALIYGKAEIGPGASMWPYSVIRAEVFEVTVGEHTNIQDFSMIHIGDKQGARIGSYCTITHRCTIHGAVIEDNCLIGIGATILEGCVVGEGSIVAAGALLKEGTVIPPNSIAAGAPGRALMKRNSEAFIRFYADMYHRNALAYAKGEHRPLGDTDFKEFAQREMARLEKELGKLGAKI
jgi:carbonic anhydrase/acetyltransferase-like protein (isoleucine patch superfamily)